MTVATVPATPNVQTENSWRFQSRLDNLLDHLNVRRADETNWTELLVQDLQNIQEFFKKFLDDLQVITGCKRFSADLQIALPILAQGYENWEEFKRELETTIQKKARDKVHNWVANISDRHQQNFMGTDKVWRLPISPVCLEKSVATFWLPTDNDRNNIYEIKLLNYARKSTDDFTRKVPYWITKRIKQLKSLNFDYDLQILDGFLVQCTPVDNNAKNFNTDFLSAEIIRETSTSYSLDPVLSIKFFDDAVFATDFWHEPWQHPVKRFLNNLVQQTPFVIFVIAAIGILLWITASKIDTVPAAFIGIPGMLMTAFASIIGVFQLSVLGQRPKWII